jgi:hypothetical protein
MNTPETTIRFVARYRLGRDESVRIDPVQIEERPVGQNRWLKIGFIDHINLAASWCRRNAGEPSDRPSRTLSQDTLSARTLASSTLAAEAMTRIERFLSVAPRWAHKVLDGQVGDYDASYYLALTPRGSQANITESGLVLADFDRGDLLDVRPGRENDVLNIVMHEGDSSPRRTDPAVGHYFSSSWFDYLMIRQTHIIAELMLPSEPSPLVVRSEVVDAAVRIPLKEALRCSISYRLTNDASVEVTHAITDDPTLADLFADTNPEDILAAGF